MDRVSFDSPATTFPAATAFPAVTATHPAAAAPAGPAELPITSLDLWHVVQGSNDAFWDWTLATGRIRYTQRWAELLGYDIRSLQGTLQEWQDLVHPDDLPIVMAMAADLLRGAVVLYEIDHRVRHRDGDYVWLYSRARVTERDDDGRVLTVAGSCTDVTARHLAEATVRQSLIENERLVAELREALSAVKTLSGMLPLCAACKKVRNDQGYWDHIEEYITAHSGALITHSICPECTTVLYPGLVIRPPDARAAGGPGDAASGSQKDVQTMNGSSTRSTDSCANSRV